MDTTGDRPVDQGQNTGPDTISVMEAARRLNVTPDAIRARIRRGTLEAIKRDGTWHVIMPADDDTTTGQDSGQHTTAATDATGAALVQLVADLTQRNAELAGAAAAWQARAGYLQERIHALEAGTIATQEPPGSPESHETGTTHTGTPLTGTTTTGAQQGTVWARLKRLLLGT